MPRLWHFVAEYLLLLPAGAVIALVWANNWPESYFQTMLRLEFIVNDVLMVLFFGLITKEVVEATVAGGVLHPWRRAALPLAAAAGLTLVPLLVFAAIVPLFDEPRLIEGWPAVFGLDLALGYLAVRVVFGRGPVIPFFLLVGICANALGVLALGATAAITIEPVRFVILMAGALAAVMMLRAQRIRSVWAYLLLPGTLSWAALYSAGFEPALALVPVIPFLPHGRRDPGFFVDAPPTAGDALSRFELWVRHPAQVALFLFGLVNAGVPLSSLYWGVWSLPIALFVAKPIGLLAGVAAARLMGLHLPNGIGWRELVVVGFISSMGFTLSLFFATAAVAAGPVLSAIKMGALVSVAGGALGLAAAAALRCGRFQE
jgi:NhaA family Na+:H+ antiporter